MPQEVMRKMSVAVLFHATALLVVILTVGSFAPWVLVSLAKAFELLVGHTKEIMLPLIGAVVYLGFSMLAEELAKLRSRQ
jgi:hypothetical protein